MQKIPQFSFLDQLILVVPHVLAVFCSVLVVLVVLTIKTLIALHGISSHLIQPLEKRLILDFLLNLMYQLSEYGVNLLRIG